MRRLLLTAVSMAAMANTFAAIAAEVTVDSGAIAGTTGASPDSSSAWPAHRDAATSKARILGDAVATESQPAPASATLAFFDSAYQQLLQGGANQ